MSVIANNPSVVARFDYGDNSFFFTGDIESPAEKEILESGENVDVDFSKWRTTARNILQAMNFSMRPALKKR